MRNFGRLKMMGRVAPQLTHCPRKLRETSSCLSAFGRRPFIGGQRSSVSQSRWRPLRRAKLCCSRYLSQKCVAGSELVRAY